MPLTDIKTNSSALRDPATLFKTTLKTFAVFVMLFAMLLSPLKGLSKEPLKNQPPPESLFKVYAPVARAFQVWKGVPASIQLAQAYQETKFGQADTIGTIYCNWFAVMAIDGDDWQGRSGAMLGCYKRKIYRWRWYNNPLECWQDYIRHMTKHGKRNLWQPWTVWVANPPRYASSGYWDRIRATIEKYELWRYDLEAEI